MFDKKDWSKKWRENNKERIKEYRQRNLDKKRIEDKLYREKNKDYYNEYNKKYYQNNKEKIKSNVRKYCYNKKWMDECKNFRLFFNNINKDMDDKLMYIKRKNHQKENNNNPNYKQWRKEWTKQYVKKDNVKQKRKEYCRNWRRINKEHIKQYDKIRNQIYYQKNKDRINKRNKEYDRKNKEYLKRKQKEWRERNREKLLIDKKTDYYKNWHRYQKTAREYYDKKPQKFYKQNIKQLKKFASELKIPYEYYNFALLSWSKTIKKLHGSKCVVCGSSDRLNAHHIFHKAFYPKLSLNINNGIPLCKQHHDEVHLKNLVCA